jgi:hypothetical protein
VAVACPVLAGNLLSLHSMFLVGGTVRVGAIASERVTLVVVVNDEHPPAAAMKYVTV